VEQKVADATQVPPGQFALVVHGPPALAPNSHQPGLLQIDGLGQP